MQTVPSDHSNLQTPEVPILLEVDPSLKRILAPEDPLHEKVRVGVQQEVEWIMEVLGIPGIPVVRIDALHDGQGEQFARLSVHGQPCPYPNEVFARVFSYMTNSIPNIQATLSDILQRLLTLFETADMPDEQVASILASFFGFACSEIVIRHPSMLLSLVGVENYIDSLTQPHEAEDAKLDAVWLLPILHTLLDLKISLQDKPTVKKIVEAGMKQESTPQDIAEDLLVALNPDKIKIYVSQAYLKALTTVDEKTGPDKFVALRKSLLDETGVIYPSLHFVVADNMDMSNFFFKINHLVLLPWVGLPSGDPGLLDHFITCLALTLKENNHCFVHRRFVQDRLQQFTPYYPWLVQRVEAKISFEQMTRVLRMLVAQHNSIRDIRFILEQLLDFLYISAEPLKNADLDLQYALSGQINASWFKEPLQMVDYVAMGLQRKAASNLPTTALASS